MHEAVDKLQGTQVYDRICLIQSLRGIGFLSAVVLMAEMGSFDLFSSPKKLYAYFGLDPAVKQSGNFKGDKVHMSKHGSSLARRVLHMIALNNLKVDKGTKAPVNPVIYDYYIRKCASKKKTWLLGLSCIKSVTSSSPCSGTTNRSRSSFRRNIVSSMQLGILPMLVKLLNRLENRY